MSDHENELQASCEVCLTSDLLVATDLLDLTQPCRSSGLSLVTDAGLESEICYLLTIVDPVTSTLSYTMAATMSQPRRKTLFRCINPQCIVSQTLLKFGRACQACRGPLAVVDGGQLTPAQQPDYQPQQYGAGLQAQQPLQGQQQFGAGFHTQQPSTAVYPTTFLQLSAVQQQPDQGNASGQVFAPGNGTHSAMQAGQHGYGAGPRQAVGPTPKAATKPVHNTLAPGQVAAGVQGNLSAVWTPAHYPVDTAQNPIKPPSKRRRRRGGRGGGGDQVSTAEAGGSPNTAQGQPGPSSAHVQGGFDSSAAGPWSNTGSHAKRNDAQEQYCLICGHPGHFSGACPHPTQYPPGLGINTFMDGVAADMELPNVSADPLVWLRHIQRFVQNILWPYKAYAEHRNNTMWLILVNMSDYAALSMEAMEALYMTANADTWKYLRTVESIFLKFRDHGIARPAANTMIKHGLAMCFEHGEIRGPLLMNNQFDHEAIVAFLTSDSNNVAEVRVPDDSIREMFVEIGTASDAYNLGQARLRLMIEESVLEINAGLESEPPFVELVRLAHSTQPTVRRNRSIHQIVLPDMNQICQALREVYPEALQPPQPEQVPVQTNLDVYENQKPDQLLMAHSRGH